MFLDMWTGFTGLQKESMKTKFALICPTYRFRWRGGLECRRSISRHCIVTRVLLSTRTIAELRKLTQSGNLLPSQISLVFHVLNNLVFIEML